MLGRLGLDLRKENFKIEIAGKTWLPLGLLKVETYPCLPTAKGEANSPHQIQVALGGNCQGQWGQGKVKLTPKKSWHWQEKRTPNSTETILEKYYLYVYSAMSNMLILSKYWNWTIFCAPLILRPNFLSLFVFSSNQCYGRLPLNAQTAEFRC